MQRLELTWVGKDVEPQLESRILIHDKSRDYGDPDSTNMLIHGDNLLTLKALEQKYHGQVKCIYIDPPYNEKSANPHYDDNLEHSSWLSSMKPRLDILWGLLREDGLLAVQIDDSEYANLYLLMCEVCGRKNLKTICVKMSEATGVKMSSVKKASSIPKLKEYIILAKRDGVKRVNLERIPKGKWDSEYNRYCDNISDEELEQVKAIMADEDRTSEQIAWVDSVIANMTFCSVNDAAKRQTGEEATDEWRLQNANRIVRTVSMTDNTLGLAVEKRSKYETVPSAFSIITSEKKMYLILGGFNLNTPSPRCKILFADVYLTVNLGDLWTDIKTTGLKSEGGVEFKKGKKPERLIYRILKMNTEKGDLVLDSFLGSGTTAAVATKMGLRWIGVELKDQCYTHCIPRLKSVIDGNDHAGITSMVNWKGGGGFKFYELAPTLIEKDKHGNSIFSDKYKPEMLVAAVALVNGYTYEPDEEVYWKQARCQENSFLYVTTQYLTAEALDYLAAEVGEFEHLLICAPAFDVGLNGRYDNIIVKKIPQTILDKCEYGVDNYNFNIVDVPEDDKEDCDD